MTYLDAAYAILHAAGQGLRYEGITQRALCQRLTGCSLGKVELLVGSTLGSPP